MRHPLAAITWEIMGRNKSILRASFLLTLTAFILTRGRNQMWVSVILPFALMFSFASIFVMASLNEYDNKFAITGFPAKYFLLPLPTWLLVLWPTFLGVTLVSINYCIWATVMFPKGEVSFNLNWMLLSIACLVIFQFTLWSLRTITWLKLLTAAIAIFVLVSVFVGFDLQRESLGRIALIFFSVIAALQVLIVHRQRSGEGDQGMAFFKLQRLLGSRSQPLLCNALAALQWYEWSRNLRALPLLTLGVTWFAFGSFVLTSHVDAGRSAFTLQMIFVYLAPLLLSASLGLLFYKSDIFSSSASLNLQQALLPVSSEQLVLSKFLGAAKASVLAWLVVLPIFILGFWMRKSVLVSTPADRFVESVFANPWLGIGLWFSGVLLSIRFLTAHFAFGMTGKAPILRIGLGVASFGTLALICITAWLDEHRPHLLIEVFRIAPKFIVLLLVLKGWMSFWALQKSRSQKELSSRTASLVLGFWALATAITVFTVYSLLANFASHSATLTWTLLFLLSFPLARTFLAFHSMTLQRHQH